MSEDVCNGKCQTLHLDQGITVDSGAGCFDNTRVRVVAYVDRMTGVMYAHVNG